MQVSVLWSAVGASGRAFLYTVGKGAFVAFLNVGWLGPLLVVVG